MAPLLADVFDRLYLPDCCGDASAAYATRHRVAIRWLAAALRREPRTSDLSVDALELLVATLANANYSRGAALKLRAAIASLWRFAERLGLAPPFVESKAARPRPLQLPDQAAARPLAGRRRGQRIELPPPDAGTLRAFFESVYRPQRLPLGSPKTIECFDDLFISFWRFLGRDAALEDCCDEQAAKYFAWQRGRGRSPRSCNKYRAHWFGVWRHAQELGLVGARPTVPKLPTERDDPDAWSIGELARLVDAAATFRADLAAGGVPYPLLFRALLIVGFHTAVRRRSLLSIACRDVDLVAGVVTVYARNVKTRRGRQYRLPPYAVESVRAILAPARELLFPIAPHYAGQLFPLLVAHAGLAPSRHALSCFHKLRRTAATAACALGGKRAASELLGHSSAYVTELYIDPAKTAPAAAQLPAIAGAAGELAEARDLLAVGKLHLAAAAARIVLEKRVATRCRALNERRPASLAAAVQLLARRRQLAAADCKLLCRAIRLANRAVHGRDVGAARVAEMIQVVEHFAGDPFPL